MVWMSSPRVAIQWPPLYGVQTKSGRPSPCSFFQYSKKSSSGAGLANRSKSITHAGGTCGGTSALRNSSAASAMALARFSISLRKL